MDRPPLLVRQTNSRPMSIFEHYCARLTIAHQHALRAARLEAAGGSTRTTSALTVELIGKMHRLATLVAEMGAGAVFGAPAVEIDRAELDRLLPP
jgi:hypothetical protein